MRHLVGFILAIALGAALFFGAGWGFTHLTSPAAQGVSLTSPTGLMALSALAATGLFLGIVIAVRAISPLAPGLPGLVLLAWSALLAVREHQALRWIPLQDHAFGAGYRALLLSGVLALLGAAMIVPCSFPPAGAPRPVRSSGRTIPGCRSPNSCPRRPQPTRPGQPTSVSRGELLALGGTGQRHRGGARRDRGCHQVEVPGPDLTLVAGGGVARPARRRTRRPAAGRRPACPRPRSPRARSNIE